MAVAQAIITRAETPRPLIVILDNDEPGRHARRQLTDSFGFQNKKDVISSGPTPVRSRPRTSSPPRSLTSS